MNSYPVSRQDNLVVQELNGEILIYDLARNKAFCLNETSALVWQLSDGKKSITEISELISKKINSPVNEDFVWFALDQLKEKLIENEVLMPDTLEGLSRRQIIKQIGLGSLVALPIISSLIAPQAVYALSTCTPCGVGVGAFCSCPDSTSNGSTCGTSGFFDCKAGCECRRTFPACAFGECGGACE